MQGGIGSRKKQKNPTGPGGISNIFYQKSLKVQDLFPTQGFATRCKKEENS